MKRKQLLLKLRSPGRILPGLLAFLLLLTISACGNKNSAQIYDNAGVLNNSKVQSAASDLSKPVAIYTTNTFQGTQADFQRTAIQKLNGNPNLIVMAIDTNSRYIYIARGSQVPLSRANVNQAVSSFAGSFHNGDYTNASIAALNSMQNSLSASNQGRSGASFSPLVPCLIIPVLLILGVAFFAASRRSRMGGMNRGGLWGQPHNPQPDEGQYYGPDQGPNQGFNQGYGPYNQGGYGQGGYGQGGYGQGGYGPPNQRGGMNPWAAGGLGAAAGGLAGYELGRRSGEQNVDKNADSGDFGGGGGNFGGGDAGGGGAGGNFGSSGDFGGGGNFGNSDDQSNFGEGGNFGGGFGGSNFFGEGGDFGGGGSDDFGGGGSFGGGDDSGGGSNF